MDPGPEHFQKYWQRGRVAKSKKDVISTGPIFDF